MKVLHVAGNILSNTLVLIGHTEVRSRAIQSHSLSEYAEFGGPLCHHMPHNTCFSYQGAIGVLENTVYLVFAAFKTSLCHDEGVIIVKHQRQTEDESRPIGWFAVCKK